MKYYIGLNFKKNNTQALVIDDNYNVIYRKSIITKNPINDVKILFRNIRTIIPNNKIYNIGVTGDNRFIIGKLLGTNIVNNEIDCIYNYAKKGKLTGNILDISFDHSKIISIKNGELIDYKIYNSSNTINYQFLYKISNLLEINLEDIRIVKDSINFKNNNLMLLYEEVIKLKDNNVDKNKILSSLIKKMFKDLPSFDYFLGELSLNKEILNYLNQKYNIDNYYSLSLGASFIAKEKKSNKIYDLNIDNNTIERKIQKCTKCPMLCEIVSIYRNNELIDSFGNNCDIGRVREFSNRIYSKN